MCAHAAVLRYPLHETRRLPRLSEEWDTDSLSKVVELQSTRAGCVHDTSIVEYASWHASVASTKQEISVGCGTVDKLLGLRGYYTCNPPVWITDDEE